MAFISGSVTNANPGPTLYALIETAALGIGWTLDDTVTIGGNTHKVLKSAAAGNTYGLDFFIDINYPTTGTTGGIRMAPFEGYTAASDVGLRGPYCAFDSTAADATTYSRYGATTSALETNWANTTSYSGLSLALTTSAFTYFISVTRDRIVMLLSNVASSIAYTGFFTPSAAHLAHAGAATFPLLMAVLTASDTAASSNSSAGSATAALTRLPKRTTGQWAATVGLPITTSLGNTLIGGQPGVAASPLTGLSQIVPVQVVGSVGNGALATTSSINAANIGQLDDVATGYINSAAIRGDSLTVGSDTWYAVTPSASFTLFFKGA